MSIIDLTGIPKTSAIVFTGAGPLDDKAYVEKFSDIANINSQLLIQGQSLFCKETGKEYIWLGGKWNYKLTNYIESTTELASLDSNMIVNGQELTCTSNGGHYVYLPNIADITTSPIVGKWYLKEQLEFDKMFPLGCFKVCLSMLDIPYPISPATCSWEEESSYDNKVLYPSSTASIGTVINQNITVENHTLTVQEIPAHQHYLSLNSCYGQGYNWAQVAWACGDTSRGSNSGWSSNTGGSQGHNHNITDGAMLNGLTVKIYKRVL